MSGKTQAELYSEIDLELSWSEDELPQVERTKHVHGLHPYLGKFVPQLVEVFLGRHFHPGERIYDPFIGSGTTLVEANAYGAEAIGCDISAFNCLLARVKTTEYAIGSLDMALRTTLEDARQRASNADCRSATEWLETWYSPRALCDLLAYREGIEQLEDPIRDVARVILSRAARSARLTTHFDLDFPRKPVRAPYHCYKHKRTCAPVEEAAKFLRRYTADTVRRIRAFAQLRSRRGSVVLHDDSRFVELPTRPDGVITSPPYPGLIDYHEQHRYAYELFGLVDRRTEEIGPGSKGASRSALAHYTDAMVEVLRNTAVQMRTAAPLIIVVNDSRGVYPGILERSGLSLEDVVRRHVNRRTGRRAGEFYESVLVCSAR